MKTFVFVFCCELLELLYRYQQTTAHLVVPWASTPHFQGILEVLGFLCWSAEAGSESRQETEIWNSPVIMHLIIYFSSEFQDISSVSLLFSFWLSSQSRWSSGPVDAGLEVSFVVGWEGVLCVLPMPLPVLHLQWREEFISVEPESYPQRKDNNITCIAKLIYLSQISTEV